LGDVVAYSSHLLRAALIREYLPCWRSRYWLPMPAACRHLPVNKAAWQDVKGAMVLSGAYEEAVKMMGDMNFLQVGWLGGWVGNRAGATGAATAASGLLFFVVAACS
jgi:hypothetical protein